MKKLFTIILLITASTAYSQFNYGWQFLHQYPQGNDLRWVKMWDANTIYAIGSKGTFIKTTDKGVTWSVYNKAGRISGIPIQRADLKSAYFFNQSTGVVVGSFGSIFRTTDGGNTFDSAAVNPMPLNATIQGVHFINNLTGYVISGQTNYRLLKSTDGGIHWFATGGTPGYSNPYAVYAFNESKILVMNQLGELFITTNGGTVWNTYATGTLVNLYRLVFIDENTGFTCGDWGRCRYTTNGGFNWNNMAGTMLNQNNHFFDLKYVNGSVYLTGNTNYLWRSSNLGASWDSISFMNPANILPFTNSFYASDFSSNGDTVVTVGNRGAIHYSQNNSKIALSKYLKSGSMRDVFASSTSGLIIAVGSSSTSTISDQILRSTDYGNNWSIVSPSTTSTADFYSIDMLDNNTGFICGSKSAVYKTINGGLNWDSISIPNMPANLVLSKIDFVNPNTGWVFAKYLTGNDSTIYKTTNAGVSWTKSRIHTATGSYNSIFSAFMFDENNGWLLDNKPRPWKTTNGGVSWDSTSLSDNYLAGSLYDIKMLDMQTGFCVGSNNRVYKTTNGGLTPWINVSYSSTTVITNYCTEFSSPNEGVVMGTYGTCYKTTNAGLNWTQENLPASIDDIYGAYLTTAKVLYTTNLLNSCILKNSTLFTTSIINFNTEIPGNYFLYQNYPNPFNPVTKIKFSIPKNQFVNLKIYDMLGREVSSVLNNYFNAGTYEVTFDASNLSSGIYFYTLNSGEFSQSKKFILLK